MSRKMKRREYISLYKRSKKLFWLDPLDGFDTEKMQALEDEFEYESIVFFRELAEAEIIVEKEKHEQTKLEQTQQVSDLILCKYDKSRIMGGMVG